MVTPPFFTEEFDTGYLTRDGEDRIVLGDPDRKSGPFGGWDGKGTWILVPATDAIRARRTAALHDGLVERFGHLIGEIAFAAFQARDAQIPQRRAV